MRRLATLLLAAAFLLLLTPAAAQNDAPIIYGNEPSLANNIVLTIDDCTIEANVRLMFDLLRQRGLTATLFPNTRHMIRQDPQLWRDMIAAGFEIGYHTRRHRAGMTPAQLAADFAQFQEEVRQTLADPGYTIRYVRPPDGRWNANWLYWAASMNLPTVRWNMTAPGIELDYVTAVLRDRERSGSILLIHTGANDVAWLQSHLDGLLGLRDANGQPYIVTSLSRALGD